MSTKTRVLSPNGERRITEKGKEFLQRENEKFEKVQSHPHFYLK